MKRITSLMAILMMVLTLVPCSSFASEKTISTFESYVNPVYQDVITESDLKEPGDTGISTYSRSRYFTEETEVIDALREAMTYRQENITIKYLLPEEIPNGYLDRWMEQACAETGNPKQGDYLRWHLAGAASVGSGFIDENGYNYTFDITVTYYTTAEQEEVVDQTVANLIMKLGISDTMSDYEKLCAVYDYVCETVTYDYTNLNDTTYTLKFSAYAALVDKTAVCQGYSNLMYRLMNEVGVNCRIIAGEAGEPHGWNIVKLGAKYYLVDATWDAPNKVNGVPYEYFAKGTEEFAKDYTANAEYMTNEFKNSYPISETDYSICDHQWEVEYTIDADPTCETTGSKSYHCELCDEIQATSKVVIPVIGHIYETVVTAPTCTTEGYTTHTCSRCDDRYVDSETDKLGHTEEELPGKEATCTSTGLTDGIKCSVCGEILTAQEEIPVKDHTYGESWESDAETHWHECICGDKAEQTAHSFKWVIDEEPTEETTGLKHEACTICGLVRNENTEIDKLQHTHVMVKTEAAAATCTAEGNIEYYTCSECENIYADVDGMEQIAIDDTIIAALNHSYETVVTAPTCTTEGYTTHTCSRCDDSYVADEVKALGHAFGEFITTTKAKFGKNGEKIAICADCEETITKQIAAPKTVKLSYGSYTYDGKVKSPLVTVYDSDGKKVSSSNYSVAYASGRKNVGKYKVTVTMKNSSTDYEKSSKYTTFKINPKGVSVSKLTKGKKSLKVTWKKPTSTYRKQMSGYQIRYSTKSSMASAKTVTVKSTTATSKTIKTLKAKKKYYVQIRAYKTVSGTKYYSAWSAKKYVTTK